MMEWSISVNDQKCVHNLPHIIKKVKQALTKLRTMYFPGSLKIHRNIEGCASHCILHFMHSGIRYIFQKIGVQFPHFHTELETNSLPFQCKQGIYFKIQEEEKLKGFNVNEHIILAQTTTIKSDPLL